MLSVTALILFLAWTVQCIKTKSIAVSYNAGVIGFGLLTLVSLMSVVVASVNKIEALVHPLGPITWVSLTLIAFLTPTTLEKKSRRILMWTIVSVTSLLGLLVIYQQFAIGAMLFPSISYLANPLWNPTGSPLSACFLLILSIPLSVHLLKESGIHHEDRNSALALIAILISIIAVSMTIWRYIPLTKTSLLPIPVGWGILLESWKHPMRAIFGVGSDQFTMAYTLGKQLSINQTALWNSSFNTNASLLLHLATVNGFLSVVALLVFIIAIIRSNIVIPELRTALILAILFLFVFPPSLPLLILFSLLCILTTSDHHTYTIRLTSLGVVFGSIVCLGIIIGSSYCWYRYTRAEHLFYQALVSQNEKNNGTNAYNLMILAMRQNPFISRYHRAFSQLNLMMGGAITTNSEEDQALVSTLLSQAIREGKTATTLAPTNVYMWTSLASIYENLIGVATDAPTWTIATYQKAITLDPVNPVLRLDLGGVYVNLKDHDNALQQFMTAVTLKPNYANGYYNLANVHKLKGNTKEAIDSLQLVLDLISPTSLDYQKISEEIKILSTK